MSEPVKWKPRDTAGGWEKFSVRPVIGEAYGTTGAPCVLWDGDRYRMWFDWKDVELICYTESTDGLHWELATVALLPERKSGWRRDIVCGPSVLRRGDTLHMWFAGQMRPMEQQAARSCIGHAVSKDGVNWTADERPVLVPDAPWEGWAVQEPCVLWDEPANRYQMWYAAGRMHAADAIGYAESDDGLTWRKYNENPILRPDPAQYWQMLKVHAPFVLREADGYALFYAGVDGDGNASLGLCRSRDGVRDWTFFAENPVVAGTDGGWDYHDIVRCAVRREGDGYRMWYAGRTRDGGAIGVATHPGTELFPALREPDGQREMRAYRGKANLYTARPHLAGEAKQDENL